VKDSSTEALNMALDLNVPEEVARHLKERAAAEYRGAVERYAADLLKEASRLEAANKGTSGDPEITSTMVKDADILLRRGYARPPKKPLMIGSQLVATVGGFVIGLLADMDKLREASTLVMFVVILAVTIAAAVIALLKD
jgi:hypothetical protein